MLPPFHCVFRFWFALTIGLIAGVGCGTTRENLATQQLLMSDAVDRSVAQIDFSPLAREKVYFDTRYVQFKEQGTVSTNYVISSLRQQLTLAGCLLQERAEDADYIVEARVGTLGSDSHDVNYGVPSNNTLNAAATIVGNGAALPVLPELSLARRTKDMAAAKIAVFAYQRETRDPVWQSGTSLAKSTSQSNWILGAGPFQSGSIHRGTVFAGNRVKTPGLLVPPDKTGDLTPQDQAFRTKETWDERLRAKSLVKNPSREEQATAERVVAPNGPPQASIGVPASTTLRNGVAANGTGAMTSGTQVGFYQQAPVIKKSQAASHTEPSPTEPVAPAAASQPVAAVVTAAPADEVPAANTPAAADAPAQVAQQPADPSMQKK